MKDEEFIEDKNDLTAAFHTMAELNPDFSGKERLCNLNAGPLQQAFTEGRMQLNHLQQATALLAYLNHDKVHRQIFVVPAGQGKSRIHAALTFLFLKNSDYDIYVVF